MKQFIVCLGMLLLVTAVYAMNFEEDTLAFLARRLDEKPELQECYDWLVALKKQMQQIAWPALHEDAITDVSLENQNIRTILFDLPPYIHGNEITALNVSNNRLEDLSLSRLLQLCPNLAALDVSHNSITYVSARGPRHELLNTLHLSHNQLKDINLGCLLSTYPNIKNLDLSDNPLEQVDWSKKVRFKDDGTTYPRINLQRTLLSKSSKGLLMQAVEKAAQALVHDAINDDAIVQGHWAAGGTFAFLSAFELAAGNRPVLALVQATLPALAVLCFFTELKRDRELEKQEERLAEIAYNARSCLLFDENE